MSDLERFLAQARGTSGSAAAAKVVHVDRLLTANQAATRARWELDSLRGRLVELSARGASATLTAAIELVVEAQTQAEPVAWIAPAAGTFYPPDVADSGVDLAALVVVRVRDAIAAARDAERLLRSGAFGLVILDLCAPSGGSADLATSIQCRLVTLAQTHDAAIVCLTDKTSETASLGSLVSLRAEALRLRDRAEVSISISALKDKRRGPGWTHTTKKRAPAGL
ncbi:MAG: recombinase A [Kofleriaceae bacterium]